MLPLAGRFDSLIGRAGHVFTGQLQSFYQASHMVELGGVSSEVVYSLPEHRYYPALPSFMFIQALLGVLPLKSADFREISGK